MARGDFLAPLEEVRACGIDRDGAALKRSHAVVIRQGLDRHLFVANALIHAYCKCGRLVDAMAVFQGMDRCDAVTWNTMMLGYVENGLEETCLQGFQGMIDEGSVVPDGRSFVAAIKACSRLAEKEQGQELGDGKLVKLLSLDRGMSLLSLAEKFTGMDSNSFISNTAIGMYVKCGSLIDARKTFDALEDRRVVSWTILMLGYCDHGEADVALELFREMQAQGCQANTRTFLAVLKACCKLAEKEDMKILCLERVMAIHSQALKALGELDLHLANTLVDSYARCGSIWDSRRLFDNMKTHSVVSWTSLMLGYVENRQENLALELLSFAQEDIIDAQMLVAAVKACTGLATKEHRAKFEDKLVKVVSLEKGMAVHSRAAGFGYDSNTFLASALVDLYAKCGSMVDSRRVFDRILKPGVVLWTALTLGYTEAGEEEKALELFSLMKLRDCRPNCQTYVAVLKASAAAGSIQAGRKIHSEVCRWGLEDEEVTANSLVDLYAKCGRMAASQQLFDVLPKRSLISWNTIIAGYSHQGNTERVFDSWHRMQDEAVKPDGITFVSILSACSHSGFIHKGKQFFAAMVSKFGVVPGIEHYGCMADLFARADELHDAVAIAESGSSTAASLAVLAACCNLKNVELGEATFKSLLEVDNGAAAYDLMANIYCQ